LTSEGESGDEEGEVDTRQRPRQDRGRGREPREGRERFERRDRRDFQGNGADRDDESRDEQESPERIPLGVLPPAIGAVEEASEEEAPKPRRRARKPRAEEGDEEIAPAA
jgi:hypothetical protein